MKFKILIILILALFVLSQCSFALGNRDSGTIIAVVYVKSLFQLSLSQGTIDFTTASHGKTSDSDSEVVVVSKSSGGDTWYLQVSNNQPLTSGRNVIPNKYFSWQGETRGKGEWYGEKASQFEVTPKIAYKSSEEEGINLPKGTQNNFKFRLFIPDDQPAGEYSCAVMFTMTE